MNISCLIVVDEDATIGDLLCNGGCVGVGDKLSLRKILLFLLLPTLLLLLLFVPPVLFLLPLPLLPSPPVSPPPPLFILKLGDDTVLISENKFLTFLSISLKLLSINLNCTSFKYIFATYTCSFTYVGNFAGTTNTYSINISNSCNAIIYLLTHSINVDNILLILCFV